MTDLQLQFCRKVAAGASLSAAYREVYQSQAKPETIHKRASELAAKPEVAARLAELRAAADDEAIMDCREARRMLTSKARELFANGAPILQLVRALDALNRMSGWGTKANQEAYAAAPQFAREVMSEEDMAAQVRRQMGLDE